MFFVLLYVTCFVASRSRAHFLLRMLYTYGTSGRVVIPGMQCACASHPSCFLCSLDHDRERKKDECFLLSGMVDAGYHLRLLSTYVVPRRACGILLILRFIRKPKLVISFRVLFILGIITLSTRRSKETEAKLRTRHCPFLCPRTTRFLDPGTKSYPAEPRLPFTCLVWQESVAGQDISVPPSFKEPDFLIISIGQKCTTCRMSAMESLGPPLEL